LLLIVSLVQVFENTYCSQRSRLSQTVGRMSPTKHRTIFKTLSIEDITPQIGSPRYSRGSTPVTPRNDIAKNVVRIVSFSGGGIRGICSAKIAAMIEELTQRPLYQSFHIFSGTSTGAIIAAALTAPRQEHYYPEQVYLPSSGRELADSFSFGLFSKMYPLLTPTKLAVRNVDDPSRGLYGLNKYTAADVIDMYKLNGRTIFSKSLLNMCTFGLYGSRYRSDGRSNVFNEFFGNLTLKNSLAPMLIPYYNMTENKVDFFKSRHATSSDLANYLTKDALMATTAAPTYFDPYEFSSIGDPSQKIRGCDGGTFANDNSPCALIEGVKAYPNAEAYFLLSIGTGKAKRQPINANTSLGWAYEIPNILVSAPEDVNSYLLKQFGLLVKKPVYYCSLDVALPAEYSLMEYTSQENVEYLLNTVDCDRELRTKVNDVCNKFLSKRKQTIIPSSGSGRPVTNFYDYDDWKVMK